MTEAIIIANTLPSLIIRRSLHLLEMGFTPAPFLSSPSSIGSRRQGQWASLLMRRGTRLRIRPISPFHPRQRLAQAWKANEIDRYLRSTEESRGKLLELRRKRILRSSTGGG
jgi:hypothetical protein